MLKNIFTWIIEILIELLMGACILLYMGPNSSARGFADIEDFRQDIWIILFFFISSGYIFSTFWFGAIKRILNVTRQSWINVFLFLIHGAAISFFAHGENSRFFLSVLLGIGAVAFSSLVGGSIRQLLGVEVKTT